MDLLSFESYPYPQPVRDELMALYEPDARHAIARLCSLNVVVGGLFAEAALAVCALGGVAPDEVQVVGSHGQTVWHQPEPEEHLPLSIRSTMQIGDAATIAARTGMAVVSDLRSADIAAGGHGAPLAPYFDWVVLRHPEKARAVQNIGGIGNVTYLLAGGAAAEVRAFDTGPGNMVIDEVVRLLTGGALGFDRDALLARGGTPDAAMLRRLLDEPYLQAPPPKTTGRELYGRPFAHRLLDEAGVAPGTLASNSGVPAEFQQRARDLIATATALTAHSIAESYRRWLPDVAEVIVNGGGSRNPLLMETLAELLAPAPVAPLDDYGVNARAKEAMAFALMAHDSLVGLPTNIPAATGAQAPAILGTLTPVRRRER
jgi:anhydro-N-acetylmuramic acid kinase